MMLMMTSDFMNAGVVPAPNRMEDELSLAGIMYRDRPAIGDYTKSADADDLLV